GDELVGDRLVLALGGDVEDLRPHERLGRPAVGERWHRADVVGDPGLLDGVDRPRSGYEEGAGASGEHGDRVVGGDGPLERPDARLTQLADLLEGRLRALGA